MTKLVKTTIIDFGTSFGAEANSCEESFTGKKEAYEAGVNWLLRSAPSREGVFTFDYPQLFASYTDANGVFDDMWINVVD